LTFGNRYARPCYERVMRCPNENMTRAMSDIPVMASRLVQISAPGECGLAASLPDVVSVTKEVRLYLKHDPRPAVFRR
jgi:hypothetical protein